MKQYKYEAFVEDDLTIKSYFGNIFKAVVSCFKGLNITFKHVWGVKPVTIEYPEVREILPANNRSRLYNDVENCISCTQCALACPVDCIYLASKKRPEGADIPTAKSGQKIKLELTQYTIDTALCCYCGLCTTVCPTECLTHTTDYEYSAYTVNDMKIDYLDPEVVQWRHRLVKD